jgi:hypothetical protein
MMRDASGAVAVLHSHGAEGGRAGRGRLNFGLPTPHAVNHFLPLIYDFMWVSSPPPCAVRVSSVPCFLYLL